MEIGYLGQSYKLSMTPTKANMAAPRLEEHSQDSCLNILRMSEPEYDELVLDGVFK